MRAISAKSSSRPIRIATSPPFECEVDKTVRQPQAEGQRLQGGFRVKPHSAHEEGWRASLQFYRLEDSLTGDFLFGSRFTETDICLFVTLIGFDAAYHGLFKTNLGRIADYPHLLSYRERVPRLPGLRETVNIDHIKADYYLIKAQNPSRMRPFGADHVIQLLAPSNDRALPTTDLPAREAAVERLYVGSAGRVGTGGISAGCCEFKTNPSRPSSKVDC